MSKKITIEEAISTLYLDIANTAESLPSLEHWVKHLRKNLDYCRDKCKEYSTLKPEDSKSDHLEILSKEYDSLTKLECSLREEAAFLQKEMTRNGWIWDT